MLSARPVAHPRRGEQGPRRGPAREANRQQAVCGLPALPVPKAPASIVLAPKVPEPPARGPAGPLFTGFSSRKTHACQPKAGWEAGPAGPAGFSCRKSLVLAGSQEPARPVGAAHFSSRLRRARGWHSSTRKPAPGEKWNAVCPGPKGASPPLWGGAQPCRVALGFWAPKAPRPSRR